jgi:nucleotide-binding universal stress UspA family protein
MVAIQRILCPTDFSEFAGHAFAQAVGLARPHRAEVKALYVVPEARSHHPAVADSWPDWARLNPAVHADLEHSLQDFVKPAAGAGVEASWRVTEGHPAREILEAARGWAADLVVMGTHGRSGFERLMLGSVTEKVLRRSLAPVLTVRHPRPETSSFARIVCPVDFSPASRRALQYARAFGREAGAQVSVVYVLEWPMGEQGPWARLPFDVPEHRAAVRQEAEERLRQLMAEGDGDACRPEPVLRGGKPGVEIVRLAEEREADLVVMGVPGRGALDLLVFGSTTHHVVRTAPCPVLTVRVLD